VFDTRSALRVDPDGAGVQHAKAAVHTGGKSQSVHAKRRTEDGNAGGEAANRKYRRLSLAAAQKIKKGAKRRLNLSLEGMLVEYNFVW